MGRVKDIRALLGALDGPTMHTVRPRTTDGRLLDPAERALLASITTTEIEDYIARLRGIAQACQEVIDDSLLVAGVCMRYGGPAGETISTTLGRMTPQDAETVQEAMENLESNQHMLAVLEVIPSDLPEYVQRDEPGRTAP